MFLVQDEHGTTLVTQACVPKHFSACLPERERSQTDAINIDELNAFLSSSDVLTFKGNLRVETCGWIGHILRTYSYFSPPPIRERTDPILHAEDHREFE